MRRTILTLALAFVVCGIPPAPAQTTTFPTPLNNVASTLAANHLGGSGTLAVKAGEGTFFGTPTPTAPIRVTVARKNTLDSAGNIVGTTTLTIFQVTGRTGDTLTGCTAVEGTADRDYAKADPVKVAITAGPLKDAFTAINTLESTVATLPVDASVVHKATAETITGVKTFAAPPAFAVDTMTYAGAITLDVTAGGVHKTTTTAGVGNATINASAAGTAGQSMAVQVVNDAAVSRLITFGTNFRSVGTLVGVAGKTSTLAFTSDGSAWHETSRTVGDAAASTATFAITDPNIVSTFVSTDTVVSGVTARSFYADAEIAFSARGSSCTLPSVYLTGSNQATVTVDGVTTALTPTTANTFAPATVFAGLADTTHNVVVKWINLQFSYIASANTVSVTGVSPALSLYPGYSQSWNILTDTTFKTRVAALGYQTAAVSGYSLLQTAAGAGSGYNFWVDTEIDLPSGSFGSVAVWTAGYGQGMCVRVDGVNYPTVVAPNDHYFHWLTLASGLPTTSGIHTCSVHVTNAPGPVYVYAVMTTGGAGLTSTTTAAARPTIAYLGDSITQALTGTGLDSSKGYAHEICRRTGTWCANRAISGTTVYDAGPGTGNCHTPSGLYRTADVATVQAVVAGTDTTVIPTTLVNLYGVNDFLGVCAVRSAAQHQSDYGSMLALQKAALPNARILVFGLGDYQGQDLTAYRAAQSAAAAGAGLPYYPLDNSLNVNFALTTYDGLHPSTYGYQSVFVPLMAPLVAGPAPLPQSADAALASGALAWSTDAAGTLKARTPAGTLTGVPGLATANVFTAAQTIPTLYGSTAAAGTLQLFSTSHATKGKILLGPTSAYDGANERIGLGTQSPARKLHATGAAGPIVARYEYTGAEGLTGTDYAGAEYYTSAGHVGDVFVTGGAYPTTGGLNANGLFIQDIHPTGNIGILVRGDDGTTSGKFFINTGGYQTANERFTILGTGGSAGFVGLTQPVPVVRLHVGAGADAPSLGAPAGTLLYLTNPGPTFQVVRDSTNHVDMTFGSNTAGGHIGTRTVHDFLLISNGTTRLTLTSAGQLTVADGSNVATGTTTGTKIGTATTQKIGKWGATPVVQGAAIADSDGTLADTVRALNALLARQRAEGNIAP